MTPSSIEQKARAQLPVIRFFQAYMPLPLANWLLKQGVNHVRMPAKVKREIVSADGVRCEWLIPQNSTSDQALLYLHGGGFVYGLTPPHLEMVAHITQKMGMRALMVDYRLAPEHPYPAALDDCVTAYVWLLNEGIPAKNIVVAGDSAGGNLTITMMMKLRDSGKALPAGAACLSPVINLSDRGNSSKNYKDPLLPARAIKIYNRSYVADNDPRDPLLSPAFGDWHDLPPLLVHVGEDELLREDAARAEELAKAAGVEVRLEIYPRMWHVWQLNLSLPQAGQSLDEIARFLRAHLEDRPERV
jgi:monoterpene epsilon-lactone hydrolase